MKKLLYVTITALAVAVAAGCSGNDDDIWNSFPESDSSLLTEINSGMADAYYDIDDWANQNKEYYSDDSINWILQKWGAWDICQLSPIQNIWFHGNYIIHKVSKPDFPESPWGVYRADGHTDYDIYIAAPVENLTVGMKIDNNPFRHEYRKESEYYTYSEFQLKAITPDTCTLMYNYSNITISNSSRYFLRSVINFRRTSPPAITEISKIFYSKEDANDFIREIIREQYGDTMLIPIGTTIVHEYILDDCHFIRDF